MKAFLGIICALLAAGCDDSSEVVCSDSLNKMYDEVSDRCVCKSGYVQIEDRCIEKSKLCDPEKLLIYSEAEKGCVCAVDGLVLKDGVCVDLNECDLGLDFCGAHGVCRNTDYVPFVGVSSSTSEYGYAFREDPSSRYSCDCEAGYARAQRFDDLYACVHKQCDWGFEKVEEGGDCVDIDECEQNMHACGDHGQCQNRDYKNEPDKYRCLCDEGYEETFVGEGEYRCDRISKSAK